MKNLSADEKRAQELIVQEIDKALTILQNHFQKYCDEVSVTYFGKPSTEVPMEYIKKSIGIFKENFKKAAIGENEN